jgi:hypothetical protein
MQSNLVCRSFWKVADHEPDGGQRAEKVGDLDGATLGKFQCVDHFYLVCPVGGARTENNQEPRTGHLNQTSYYRLIIYVLQLEHPARQLEFDPVMRLPPVLMEKPESAV